MNLKRILAPAIVAAAILTLAAACGGSDDSNAPAPGSPLASDQNVVVANGAPSAATPAGTAPAPRMLAIDRGTLLRNSAAGKSILAQAQQLQRSAEAEFKGEADRLQADARAFQQQAAILAAAVKAQRQRELEARQSALQQKMQARGGEIQAGINNAVQQIERALQPILTKIMQERHADILVDKQAIVMSLRDDMDVTPVAIQRLDQIMPTVKVTLGNPAAQPGAPVLPAPGH